MFWSDNRAEAGQVLHAYHSAWLPAGLLEASQQERLVEALIEAAGNWQIALHLNKGLAGAPAQAIAATRDTATNPSVLSAFALLICASEGEPAYPGIKGHSPDVSLAREETARIAQAMTFIDRVAPRAGSYVSESDYFHGEWREAFWGSNYPRLLAAKDRYDPGGLFIASGRARRLETPDIAVACPSIG